MKKVLGMFAVVSLVGGVAFGDIYYDPTGDIATGNANLDITQVEITDDGTNLFVSLTLADLDADWGKYLFFADILSDDFASGSGDNDNPWGRDIAGLWGTDYFVGSWVDGGGGASASMWGIQGGWIGVVGEPSSMSIDWATSTITWNLSHLMGIALDSGANGFNFEIATTGGSWGDPAIDLLGGEGIQPGWGGGSTSTDWMYYEFSTIPAPSALALLALAGLGRRRRS